MQAVASAPGVDLIAFETVPCLKELRAISRLLRTEPIGVPAWISCSAKSGTSISHGEDLIGEQSMSIWQDCCAAAMRKEMHTCLGARLYCKL